MSNTGPLIASFSGKTMMLHVPNILKETRKLIEIQQCDDPWRCLCEATIESVLAASGLRSLKPINPRIIDSLAEQCVMGSPSVSPSELHASMSGPINEAAVSCVIRKLQKDASFLEYFESCVDISTV